MKRLLLLSTLALSLAAAPTPPLPPQATEAQVPLPTLQPPDHPLLADPIRDVERAMERAQRHVEEVHLQLAQAGSGGYAGAPLPPPAPVAPSLPGHRPASAVLVLPTDTLSNTQQFELQEDLAVMTRVLERAAIDEAGGRPRRAMGVDLVFWGAPRSPRAVYLQDYGAVFTLQVSFPLLAPAAEPKAEQDQPVTPEDAEWEAARRELYGAGPDDVTVRLPDINPVFRDRYGLGSSAEPYTDAKVEKLQQNLLEALKHAARIRHLQADEFILVLVQGPAARTGGEPVEHRAEVIRHEVQIRSTGDSPQGVVWTQSGTPEPAGTLMTLRVRKSDAEAFAQGTLSLEDLQRRVVMHRAPGGGLDMGWLSF